jgi:preflagellin peptidase FlaK
MYLPIIPAFIATIIATYTDLDRREIPDWLTWGLVVIGFAVNIMLSVYYKSWIPVVHATAALGIFYIFALIVQKLKIWGDGDSKLIMGLAVLLVMHAPLAPWPYVISLLLNSVLFGIALIIVSMIYFKIRGIKIEKDYDYPLAASYLIGLIFTFCFGDFLMLIKGLIV